MRKLSLMFRFLIYCVWMWLTGGQVRKQLYTFFVQVWQLLSLSLSLSVYRCLLLVAFFCKALFIIILSFCSNPDQSKHLETARMRLFDMWIDFVNLRSEEYTENSRIPSKVYNCPVFCLETNLSVLLWLHICIFFLFFF